MCKKYGLLADTHLILAVLVGDVLLQALLAAEHLLTLIAFEQLVAWVRFQVSRGHKSIQFHFTYSFGKLKHNDFCLKYGFILRILLAD